MNIKEKRAYEKAIKDVGNKDYTLSERQAFERGAVKGRTKAVADFKKRLTNVVFTYEDSRKRLIVKKAISEAEKGDVK